MAGPVRSDDELVAATLCGEADAFSCLVARYQRPLLALVHRMVGDPQLAEDLAQEAFVRAYRRLASYEPGRKFSSWLFKVAHNRTIDHLRRRTPPQVDLQASDAAGETAWDVLPADEDQASPARRLEIGETARAVGTALQRLRPGYRQVLLLRFQQDLSYQDIADVTGATLATVKVQLHRARKALARELETLGFAAPEAFSSAAGTTAAGMPAAGTTAAGTSAAASTTAGVPAADA